MDYVKIFFSSIASLAALFVSTKVIGNKQMSQLNMFDYINGITIGSIAADMAIHLDNNILYPLIAIFVYTAIIAGIGYVSSKSTAARRILTGKSIILMDEGKIYRDNFKTAKIDLNEFLTQCRINGYYNIDNIETAVLEQNGAISFMPRAAARPAAAGDLEITPQQERPFYCIVSDGNILRENMEMSGISADMLIRETNSLGLTPGDVFAAFTDGVKISVYPKIKDAPKNDFSQ